MILVALGVLLAQSTPLEPTHRFKAEGEYAWRVEFMPGGRMFLVDWREKGGSTASLVEFATGKQVLRIAPGERRSIEYFTLSHDRSTIAGIAGGVYLSAWDARTGKQLLEIWPSGTITRPALSPDGKIIAHANPKGGPVPLYQVGTGKLIRSLPRDTEGEDASLVFSPDGKHLVSATHDEPTVLWSLASGRQIATLAFSTDRDPIFSPDGELLILLGEKVARIYRVADQTEVRLLRPDDKDLVSLSLSPDFRMIALGTKDGVQIREIASGTDAFRIATTVYSTTFSPDSGAFAACAKTGFLVWQFAPEGLLDLAEDERMELWKDLASREATAACPAVAKLARGGPAAADFLRRRLLDRPLDGPRLKALAAALAGDDVAARDKAVEEAAEAAHDPALWTALEQNPSGDVKTQSRRIAEAQRAFVLQANSLLRRQRAVWVLERMGAQDPLAEISGGDVRARQTIDARAALQRLRPR